MVVNNGNGALGAPTYYDTSRAAGRVAIVDVNNDGKRDVVVTTSLPTVGDVWIAVFLNQGNGLLGTRADFVSGLEGAARAMAVGDANADGALDVVVSGNAGVSMTLLAGSGTERSRPRSRFVAATFHSSFGSRT